MLLSAKEARRKSEKQNKVKKEFELLEELISQATNDGKFEIILLENELQRIVENDLKKMGYLVEHSLINEKMCTTIKW